MLPAQSPPTIISIDNIATAAGNLLERLSRTSDGVSFELPDWERYSVSKLQGGADGVYLVRWERLFPNGEVNADLEFRVDCRTRDIRSTEGITYYLPWNPNFPFQLKASWGCPYDGVDHLDSLLMGAVAQYASNDPQMSKAPKREELELAFTSLPQETTFGRREFMEPMEEAPSLANLTFSFPSTRSLIFHGSTSLAGTITLSAGSPSYTLSTPVNVPSATTLSSLLPAVRQDPDDANPIIVDDGTPSP